MFVDDEKSICEIFDMVKNFDLHTLFDVIDEEEFFSDCINLVVDEYVKEIIGIYRIDESIGNHEIENCWQKERHELSFKNYVEDYHEYGGLIDEWVDINKFSDQVRLVAELCAKYKHASTPTGEDGDKKIN